MATPSEEYRRVRLGTAGKLKKGLDAKVNSLLGIYRRRRAVLAGFDACADKIESQAEIWRAVSDHEMRQRLLESREKIRRGGRSAEAAVIPAMGMLREVAERQIGLRPFRVQLVGALALHRGYLVEMATGEGKTLTAGLAAVLAGWTRRPCHIITANDYLVRRDEEWLKRFYEFCGVSVGYVTAEMKPLERRKEYSCDVTYTTSKELLADFLRDRLQLGAVTHPTRRLIRVMLLTSGRENLVLRGLDTAIVDEADSILIDEAVTPLIISTARKNEHLREASLAANEMVSELAPGTDYTVDERYREVQLTKSGIERLRERCAGRTGLWRGSDRRVDLIRQALTAREFFQQGKQYVVSDGKVVIVDEFTGRPMPQRSWRQGLHQAVEAKEGVNLTDPTETIARLSFQKFFRLFRRLSGMTGTAHEASEELWHVYKLPVVRVPTNRPCVRAQWPERVFSDEDAKYTAIAEEVERLHRSGRPVLIGTRNVSASERVAALLEERGLAFRLLNAVRLAEEANIIALAGEKGQITIATNMAGRGTDIKLGRGVTELGGLHVIASERHESGRVDRQFFGRSGRQGDPGSAQAFVSVEDELLRRHLHPAFLRQVDFAVRRRLGGWERIAGLAVRMAQRSAQKTAFKQRLAVLKMDDWLEEALSFAGAPLA